MAKPPKSPELKVYRTPIGFHDAYVAAPSQKAALAAWGTSKNLFARGDAEIVTDATLTAEPLAKPGEIVRRARGTGAEHMAALHKDEPPRSPRTRPAAPERPRAKPKPRPSRSSLERAEAALEQARAKHRREEDALDTQIAELTERRRSLRDRNTADVAALEAARASAEADYDRVVERWRED